MNKKEVEIDRNILVETTINDVKSKISGKNFDENLVYYTIKDFLKKYLEANYEFTASEVKNELDRTYMPSEIKQDFKNLIDKISVIEYSNEKIEEEESKKILLYFYYILKNMNKKEEEPKGFKKFLHKILRINS